MRKSQGGVSRRMSSDGAVTLSRDRMTPRIQGILLMMASMVVFTLLDSASAKYVTHTLPAPVGGVLPLSVASILLSCHHVAGAGGPALAITRHPGLQVLARCCC
jgi:hypothetical protein